jgi:hypothetical protein
MFMGVHSYFNFSMVEFFSEYVGGNKDDDSKQIDRWGEVVHKHTFGRTLSTIEERSIKHRHSRGAAGSSH